MRTIGCLALAFALLFGLADLAFAKRIALVVGNDAYLNAPKLTRAAADAHALHEALRRLDFSAEIATDLDYRDFARVFGQFLESVEEGDEVVFHYSGHGVAIDGRNYLLPVDIEDPAKNSEAELKSLSRDTAALVEELLARKPKYVFMILDACRDNPFVQPGRRGIGAERGLARMEARSGSFILFSAGPGETALDRLPGHDPVPNSVFTRMLLEVIETPGLRLPQMANALQGRVLALAATANHRQFPDYFDRIVDDPALKPSAPEETKQDAGREAADVAYSLAVANGSDAVLAEFVSRFPTDPRVGDVVQTITNRADDRAIAAARRENTTEAYEEYRIARPNGRHVAEAAEKFAELSRKSSPEATHGCGGVQVQVGLRDTERTACLKPGAGESFSDCAECPEMVVVPSGTFTMGSTGRGALATERPSHRITIPNAFAVGRFEVTFAEWEACVQAGGCGGHSPADQGWGRGHRPAIMVSWSDAQGYVRWLSSRTGKSYGLPSEAEWEYVARAGTRTSYWWGNSFSSSRAHNASSGTVPVESFAANPWGLHQVHGNVWEWVEDCWNANYRGKPNALKNKGSAWLEGDCHLRVARGGSWGFNPPFLRAASRPGGNGVDIRSWSIGFRVVRALASP